MMADSSSSTVKSHGSLVSAALESEVGSRDVQRAKFLSEEPARRRH